MEKAVKMAVNDADERFDFYNSGVANVDPDVYKAIQDELVRESDYLELIASENMTSYAVMQAQGSVQTATVMTGMIAIGIVGMIIDVLLRQGEGWLRRRRGLEA